ncbi:MAG: diguanylate cyclase, partial [Alphaproteobacteria bacterium]|nr:diguanylate cyclase [Alphaproteobacteria bacterium]
PAGKEQVANVVEFTPEMAELDESLGKIRELTVQPRQGRPLGLALKVVRSISEDGKLMFHLLLRDNSLRRAMDGNANRPKTSRQFTLDDATGLPDSRTLPKEYTTATSLRDGNDLVPATLALISLDGFRDIADRFGDEAAHKLLGSVGSLFIRNLRDVDTVAYLGSGQLGLVLVGADTPGAHVALGRLRWLMSANVIQLNEDEKAHFTISAGFCEIRPGVTYEETLEKCGQALKWAEESGGNFAQECVESAA